MNQSEEKEALKLFKVGKSSDNLLKEVGPKKTTSYLKEFIENGYIDSEDKKFKLTDLGHKKLETITKNEKKNEFNDFIKHPLLIVVVTFLLTISVSIPLTSYYTHRNTVEGIEYQKTITLSLLGKQEINTKPEQHFLFNSLIVYNPTNNKISLKGVYVSFDENWIKLGKNFQKEMQAEIKLNETDIDLPQLETSYAPYMELEPGETKLISGFFELTSPKEKGRYTITFFTETIDGKRYIGDKSLIINVI